MNICLLRVAPRPLLALPFAANEFVNRHPEELDAMDEDEESPMPPLPVRSGNAGSGNMTNGTT